MPYKKIADLPEQAKSLPTGAKKIFMKAFNSAYGQYGNDASAMKVAWSAVKTKYKKSGDKWVLASEVGMAPVYMTKTKL